MTRLPLTALALGVLIAGCSRAPEGFDREAGMLIDTGHFGNATMNNHQLMTGEKQYVYDLSQRFASEVLTTVNFAFNSAALDQGAIDTLREQARWIRQFPEIRFRVYGHTDKVGSDGYNKALGLRRAHAVVNYLVSQGISRSRLEAVVSYGETQPLIVTEGQERRNRRTVTEVSGFVSSHPTVMDGKYAEVIYREYINSAEPRTGLETQQGQDLAITQ
ncbi:OmpA family protein [Maliponia aquimaris]|uniref:Outer membrane lipoprotein Omp16 n=1 Tax=Maliponia aquimaris TaxID=1673631 RepID=A0A238KHK9_9RHOB|nr:OmpA family protein [Maliponia aquimaris]SMX42281.1 Outer membrane lipoprotein Omp16 precursor [Maliponia aquimaris]